eukprot:EG_transcript_18649
MRYARHRRLQGAESEGVSGLASDSPVSCTTASSADFRQALRRWAQTQPPLPRAHSEVSRRRISTPARDDPSPLAATLGARPSHHLAGLGPEPHRRASSPAVPEKPQPRSLNLNRRVTLSGPVAGLPGLRRFSIRSRQPSAPGPGQLLDALELGGGDFHAVLGRKWEQHELEFDVFAASPAEVIFHSDVPWPDYFSANDVLVYVLDKSRRSASKEAHQSLLRPLLLRWHPDKFQQRFGERLAVSDIDYVMERVKVIFQLLMDYK